MELKDYLGSDNKVYVHVNTDHLADGRVFPRFIIWEDGKRYKVDKIIDIRPAASLKAGGAGVRYTIRVGKRETYMFLEEGHGVNRWFMERKETNVQVNAK